jgi:hypothetical protein
MHLAQRALLTKKTLLHIVIAERTRLADVLCNFLNQRRDLVFNSLAVWAGTFRIFDILKPTNRLATAISMYILHLLKEYHHHFLDSDLQSHDFFVVRATSTIKR